MTTKNEHVKTMVRIHPEVKQRFKLSVLHLALSERARFHDAPPTMELVTSALWRWFSSLSLQEAEEFLAREFPLLGRTIDGFSPDSQEPDIPSRDISPKKRKGRTA